MIIQITGILSLIVQIITGLIDGYVLTFEVTPEMRVLYQLLLMEFTVQVIEGMFYIWMLKQFTVSSNHSNITKYRYWDWVFTTPTMLITLSIYLKYKSDLEVAKKKPETLPNYIKQYFKPLLTVVIMNSLMLLFGYLGETGVLSIGLSTVLGFIPFFIMFYIIYQTFVIYIPEAKNIFLYFVCVWGLYGIAALMPYNIKNASYNILDLFAKNFFGLFLAYTIYTKLKSNTNKNITNITNINNKNQIPIDKSL
jgi:hypothetical protein